MSYSDVCIYVYHTDMRMRTKPLRDDLGASKDKSGRALDGCPCRWPKLGKTNMATAKDEKGWCRAAPTTTEPDKKKEPSSASGQGQKHPSKPIVR